MTNKTNSKKEALLEKIENLFYNKTFTNVSMQDIAQELDIKKASLYYHFPSKDELINQTVEYSFSKYKSFIEKISEEILEKFIEKFLYFPKKSKNLFSIINQNWYCDNKETKTDIRQKQEIIFNILDKKLKENHKFSTEKTFLLISLLDDLWKKRCLFWNCPISIEKLIEEIYKIFLEKN